jgi:hypothetical protein
MHRGDYMRKIVFGVLVLILFLVACASEPVATPPANTQTTTQPTAQEAADAEPTVNEVDATVNKLFSRSGQVKSYSFDLAKLPDARAIGTYYVKGDKIKIIPVSELVLPQGNVDVIYLDLATQTAIGYCSRAGTCNDPQKQIIMKLDEWNVVLPPDWVNQIKYGKTAGTLTFYDRTVTRVKYEADEKYYEAYVDNFYGFPQRIAVAEDPEMTKIVSGYEFRNMAFNKVADADVVHS